MPILHNSVESPLLTPPFLLSGHPVNIALIGGSISQRTFGAPMILDSVPGDQSWHAVVHR